MNKLFLLAAVPLLSATSPAESISIYAKCLDHIENIESEKEKKPVMRTLDKEAPAAQIAAVDRRVDNCPVLVVMDDQLANQPSWTPPKTPPVTKIYPAFDD